MRTIIRDNYEPQLGDYHEKIVRDEARGKQWLFDCDGVFTDITNESCVLNEKGNSKTCAISQKAFTEEADALENKDTDLQEQIDALAASSDVTDIVGTYAELQAYDTSTLSDNDIIKVLQDETHNDETTYYRWSTTTQVFSLIGEEGPYYTKAAANQKFQDKLTAGAHISIDANNEISANYTHFTGATSLADGTAGLVPAPVAGDEDKALKGDGTWGNVSSQTIFYANLNETGNTRHIYKDINFTTAASAQDIIDANDEGQVILRGTSIANPTAYSDSYLQNAFVMPHNNDYEFVFLDRDLRYEYTVSSPIDTAFYCDTSEIQPKLTAGTNINISGTTISATDTTYSNFVGTDGQTAGSAGLVPGPATTDAGKFLKADGTWDNAGGGTLYNTYGQNTDGAMTQKATTDLVYTAGDPTKINIGDNGITGGADSIIIGTEDAGTVIGAADQIIIGHNATTSYADTILIGHTTESKDVGGIAIGKNARTSYHGIRIGYDDPAYVQNLGSAAVGIGYNVRAMGGSSVAIGPGTQANGNNSVAIGNNTLARNSGVAIGFQSHAVGSEQVTIGNGIDNASNNYAVQIGYNAARQIGSIPYAIALGAYSNPRAQGVMDISTSHSSGGNYGYQGANDSARTNLRVISGVHDPDQAQDAATKNYVDTFHTVLEDSGTSSLPSVTVSTAGVYLVTASINYTAVSASSVAELDIQLELGGTLVAGTDYILQIQPDNSYAAYATATWCTTVTAAANDTIALNDTNNINATTVKTKLTAVKIG